MAKKRATKKTAKAESTLLPASFDFRVDRHRLIEQIEEQPQATYEVYLAMADVKDSQESLKIELALMRAEVSSNVRESPEDYGIEKVTEAAIKEEVEQDEDVQAIVQQMQINRKEIDFINAALEGLKDRKKALENATSLFIAGYFSNVKVASTGKRKLATTRRKK